MQSAVLKLLAQERQAAAVPIPPPTSLDAVAAGKWREVVLILQARGDVGQGDLDALAAYCVAWSQWTTAQAQVATLGMVVKTPAGFASENPYLGIARKAQIALRQWGGELKLTPKSRKQADVVVPANQEPSA
jgi:P27 family predicted phage terminase small subunit